MCMYGEKRAGDSSSSIVDRAWGTGTNTEDAGVEVGRLPGGRLSRFDPGAITGGVLTEKQDRGHGEW
jgi:hypothetical protein